MFKNISKASNQILSFDKLLCVPSQKWLQVVEFQQAKKHFILLMKTTISVTLDNLSITRAVRNLWSFSKEMKAFSFGKIVDHFQWDHFKSSNFYDIVIRRTVGGQTWRQKGVLKVSNFRFFRRIVEKLKVSFSEPAPVLSPGDAQSKLSTSIINLICV